MNNIDKEEALGQISKAIEIINEATEGASEGCGLIESIQLLISQRDNSREEAKGYKKKMELKEWIMTNT